jgi:hypothetical protein
MAEVASGPRGGRAPVMVDDYDGPMGGGFGTRPQPPAPGTVPRMSGPNGMARRPDEQKRGGAVPVVIVTGLLVALFAACFMIFSATGLGSILRGNTHTATPTVTVVLTKVPDFTTMQRTDALAAAQTAHLQASVKFVQDAGHPKDEVIAQDVPAGKSVPYNTPITLTVSQGAGTVKVPNVVGIDSGQACLDLQNVGLTCNVPSDAHQYSATVPFGDVIRTDPPANTVIDLSDSNATTINLWVSLGPPPTPTPDPNQPKLNVSPTSATEQCATSTWPTKITVKNVGGATSNLTWSVSSPPSGVTPSSTGGTLTYGNSTDISFTGTTAVSSFTLNFTSTNNGGSQTVTITCGP